MKITVIDGQGGSLGKALVAAIKKRFPHEEVFAIGTNALAASAMLGSGADAAASGENPVGGVSKKRGDHRTDRSSRRRFAARGDHPGDGRSDRTKLRP